MPRLVLFRCPGCGEETRAMPRATVGHRCKGKWHEFERVDDD